MRGISNRGRGEGSAQQIGRGGALRAGTPGRPVKPSNAERLGDLARGEVDITSQITLVERKRKKRDSAEGAGMQEQEAKKVKDNRWGNDLEKMNVLERKVAEKVLG